MKLQETKIDIKFIKFYIISIYNKSIDQYFCVQKSTISNWRKRGMPSKYVSIFINNEKSNDIYVLFKKIYPMKESEL